MTKGHPDREELRIALAMNGGVSLAVWIGGLTREVNRVLRHEGVYRDLLDLLQTVPRVDVISGTSAGGINGALLALATVRDQSLDVLESLWIERGAFDALLRDPLDPLPASLLMGDEYFLEELKAAFSQLNAGGPLRPSDEVPIDLALTVTLLKGEPVELADDFGQAIADVRHRAAIRFQRGVDVDTDPFLEPDIVDRLALASRSTACFPIAFEPSFIPVDPEEAIAGRPDMKAQVDFGTSRFVVDGGLLDNKPLEGAMEAIYGQRTTGDSRRVLLYVVPNPGEGGADTPDDPGTPPETNEIALASLFRIPRVEPIASEVREIRRRNREALEARESRIVLSTYRPEADPTDEIQHLSGILFPTYQAHRTHPAISYIVSQIADGLAALAAAERRQPPGTENAPRLWLERQSHRSWLVQAFHQHAVPWVPEAPPPDARGGDLPPELRPDTWGWGIRAVEHAASQVMDLLRRTQRLVPLGHEARQDGNLPAFWHRAYTLTARIRAVRRTDGGFWQNQASSLAEALEAPTEDPAGAGLVTWVEEKLKEWRNLPCDPGPGAFGKGKGTATLPAAMGAIAHQLAKLIHDMSPVIREVLEAAEESPVPPDPTLLVELSGHLDYLSPAGADGPEEVLRRLVLLEVVQEALGHGSSGLDEYVELSQVSGNTPSPFGGPARAEDKLAGVQLGHFGAFYKRSWRANDWMFGRLDGAANLIQVILNPDRFRRIAQMRWSGSDEPISKLATEAIRKLAVDDEPNAEARAILLDRWDEGRAARELAFLDKPKGLAPDTLPICTDAIVRRIQLETIRESLVTIAHAVELDEAEGGFQPGPAARLLRAVQHHRSENQTRLDAEAALRIFHTHVVGKERIAQESGSDRFSMTVAQTVAVLSSMAYRGGTDLGPAKQVFRMARAASLAFYLMTRNVIRGTRTGAALNGAAIAAGATIVVLGLFGVAELPTLVSTAGWALLGGGILVGLVRWKGVALAALLGAGGIWLLRGWVESVYPWLAPDEWGPLAAIVTIVAVLLFFGSVRRPRWWARFRAWKAARNA